METKGEWNALSQEDAMIMALTSLIESKSKSSSKSNSKEKKGNSNLTDEEKIKAREAKIPDWKKKAPDANEPKSKVVDGRTYYWCTKCREGKGMWAMHEKHDSNFQAGKSGNQTANKDDKPENKKKVTFSAVEDKSDDKTKPEITVKEDLLKNAKAYLSQFSDFQKGGTQGS